MSVIPDDDPDLCKYLTWREVSGALDFVQPEDQKRMHEHLKSGKTVQVELNGYTFRVVPEGIGLYLVYVSGPEGDLV